MSGRWFKRDRDEERSPGYGADPVEDRIERQARRAGRTAEDEQERILQDVLPNVRKAVAEAGLTMDAYLRLNRVEYEELLAAAPSTRSFLGRNTGLIDYEAFVRLRRWIHAAAERAGEDVESWVVRVGTSAPRRPWERATPVHPPSPRPVPPPAREVPTSASADEHAAVPRPGADDVLDRLERLAALRDSGALTEDEFRAQKRRLLGD